MLLTYTFIFQMPHKKRAYTLVFTSIFKSFHQLVLSKSTFIIYVINKIKQKKQPIFQMYEDYQLGSQWSVRESLWVCSL